MTRRGILLVALAAMGMAPGARGPTDPPPTRLTVFAAASLTETFGQLGKMLEQRHPGLSISFNFAGSQELARQILEGAPADVFASADDRWMSLLRDSGFVAG